MTADEMRQTAAELLAHAEDARRPFDDDRARRWIEYRPRERPGVSLAALDLPARKAAHRLLASALSTHAFAQAAAIMALEEVLHRAEGYRRARNSDDSSVVIFGKPADRWGGRFGGHHISWTVTLAGATVPPAPPFPAPNPRPTDYA